MEIRTTKLLKWIRGSNLIQISQDRKNQTMRLNQGIQQDLVEISIEL